MIYIMILQKTTELLKYVRFNSRKSYQLSLTVILWSQYSFFEEERGILKKICFHTIQLQEDVHIITYCLSTSRLFQLNQHAGKTSRVTNYSHNNLLSFYLYLLIISQAYSNISLGSSLYATDDNSTWASPSGDFAFGFRMSPSEKDLFLLAIWTANGS